MSNCDEEKELKQKIFHVCRDYLQGPWEKISVEDVELTVVKGGLSSSGLGLYLCALPDSFPEDNDNCSTPIPRKVLVRFHNSNVYSQEEIIQQNVVFAILSEKKLGPKLCGIFPGGRLEEYMPSRVTDWNDFRDLYTKVAKEVAKFHSIQMPIKKSPPLFDEMTHQWYEEYENAIKERSVDINEFVSSGEFKRELAWLMGKIREVNPKVTCCHNDLNGGNILLLNNSNNNEEKRIKFIDFEFVGYNYRSIDMAAYFLIRCFYFKPAEDPTKLLSDVNKYPTESEQREFVKAYVNQFCETNMLIKSDDEKEEEVNDILKELEIMKFAPALYWISFMIKETVNPLLNLPLLNSTQIIVDLYKDFKKKMSKEDKLQNGS